ncbi:MAG: Transcription antitermination protein nusG [Parcubacteria group bacterium GW2011_GWB1_57_6]|nr:MAG: Transcription antitermination protein nusG [Parcubacteria group bacterium GW2011_GWA1_56_13]KKW47037.1 MAG: Transcription antitermination protein nusG [Parcubacteria group bacterium GW2011_GWB1_57_6]
MDDPQTSHGGERELPEEIGMADIAPAERKEVRDETAPRKEDARWYTIHTYAGYENAVERNLKQRIESLGMENKIFDVVVPTEKKIRVKGGKRLIEEEKIYPGYILVRMIVDDDSWFVVRNTPRVTGFVGSGNTPVPMEESEVASLMKRMTAEAPKHHIDLVKDDQVVIADGPFKDLEGKVGEIDEDRGKVKVMVSMFGRETPVELDFLQIRKL